MTALHTDPKDYDRILKTALREVEVEIVALVERAYAGLPPDASALPIIGGWPFLDCERSEQKRLAVAALRAKQWFRFEAPPWAQPLPLTAEACYALFNGRHRSNLRSRLRGEYGQHARTMHWAVERMTPFEVFCAQR